MKYFFFGKALEELKKTIFSVPSIKKRESHYDDVRLLRFLRARDFNVKQAEAMLIANAVKKNSSFLYFFLEFLLKFLIFQELER